MKTLVSHHLISRLPRRHAFKAMIGALGLAGFALAGSAQVHNNWNGLGDSFWHNDSNWTLGTAPDGDSEVHFGTATLLNPAAITINGATVNSYSTHIGWVVGSSATLNVTNGASWTNTNHLIVGHSGAGTLNLTNGTIYSDALILANMAGGSGTVTIDGASSSIHLTDYVSVGRDDIGTLSITNSGALYSNAIYIGKRNGGIGTLTVDNGILDATTYLYAGQETGSQGTLIVQNGGNVSAGGVRAGWKTASAGTIKLLANSMLDVSSGTIDLGADGAGTLDIIGGHAIAQNVVLGKTTGNGTLTLGSGGILETSGIERGTGAATLGLNRGTIIATTINNNFFKNFGDITLNGTGVGASDAALTFEVGTGLTVTTTNHFIFTDDATVSVALRKQGDGTLIMSGSGAANGHAIYSARDVRIEVDGSGTLAFANNYSGGFGGAIYSNGNFSVTGNQDAVLFNSNTAFYYSVVYANSVLFDMDARVLSISDNVTRDVGAGAVVAELRAVTLRGQYESILINSNTSTGWYGGALFGNTDILLDASASGVLEINNNYAGGNPSWYGEQGGGALNAVEGNVTISGSYSAMMITSNSITLGHGGAIFAGTGINLTVAEGSTLEAWGNNAEGKDENGGFVYSRSGNITLDIGEGAVATIGNADSIANKADSIAGGSGVAVNKLGTGLLVLNANNSKFTGDFNLDAGEVQVSNTLNLFSGKFNGSGTLVLDDTDASGGFVFNTTQVTGDFDGTVRLQNGSSLLLTETSNNTILQAAALELAGSGTAIVDAISTNISALNFNGGVLDLSSVTISFPPEEILHVDGDLAVTSGTIVINSNIFSGSNPLPVEPPFPDQDNFMGQSTSINADSVLLVGADNVTGDIATQVQVINELGQAGTGSQVVQFWENGDYILDAHYDYTAITGTNSGTAGLWLSYALTELELQDQQTLTLHTDTGTDHILAAAVTGAGGLTISSTGTPVAGQNYITLSSALNTYTGTTTVENGNELRGGNTDVIAHSAALVLEGAAIFDTGAYNQAVQSLRDDSSGLAEVKVDTGVTFILSGSSDGTFTGSITGNGALTKTGDATQDVGEVMVTGLTKVGQGTLNVIGSIAASAENAAILNVTGDIGGTLTTGSLSTTIVNGGIGSNVLNRGNLTIDGNVDGGMTNYSTGQVNTVGNIANGLNNSGLITQAGDVTGNVINIGRIDRVGAVTGNVTNSGTATVYGAISGSVTNSGTLLAKGNIGNGLNNTATGIITLETGTIVAGGLTNAGIVHKLKSVAGATTNTGVINLAAGNSTFSGNVGGVGGTIRYNNASSNLYEKITITGNLSGSQTFANAHVNLANNAHPIILDISGVVTGTHALQLVKDPTTSMANDPEYFSVALIKAGTNNGVITANSIDDGMWTYQLQPGDGGTIMPDQNKWYLSRTALNRSADAILSTAGVLGTEWHYTLDAVYLRMGDLRAAPHQASLDSGNLWVRANAYHLNAGADVAGRSFDQDTYGLTAGGDKAFPLSNGVILAGGFLQMGRSERSHDYYTGDSSSSNIGAGAYLTWLLNEGWFVDATVKFGRIKNNIDVRAIDGFMTTAQYHNTAQGLSVELGRRIAIDRFWIEPTAQVAAAWINGTDYSASNGLNVTIEDTDSWQYRVQMRGGATYGKWLPYVKIGGVKTDSNGGDVIAQGRRFDSDFDGWRLEAGAGVGYQINERSQVYLDYEYGKADAYERPWAINLGYRCSW